MRYLLTLPLLVVLVATAPFQEERVVITTDDYPEHLVIYESKYDIVDIMVPLKVEDDTDSSEEMNMEDLKNKLKVFFIEADFEDGRRTDKGVYVYTQGKATKVMDSGKAIAASYQNENVFIGTKDGLFVYDSKAAEAYKYGKFDDNIKDMATEVNTDTMYVLTEDRVLYKVYDSATMKEEVKDVKNAEQIMMDYSNNLYFYGDDKKPYVRNFDGGIKTFEGFPQGTEVRFFRPSMLNEYGMEFLVDNEMYTLYPNGQFEPSNFAFMPDAKPTAYSMETYIFRYFGYKKKIYAHEIFSTFISEPYLITNEV